MTYHWVRGTYFVDSNGERHLNTETLSGENKNTLDIRMTEPCTYWCYVTDFFGNQESKYFTLVLDNGFSASAAQEDVYVNYGESAELSVTVTAYDYDNLKFLWKRAEVVMDNGVPTRIWVDMPDVMGASYVIPTVTENEQYQCEVHDKYDTIEYVNFYIDCKKFEDCTFYPEEYAQAVYPREDVQLQVLIDGADKNIMQYAWYAIVETDDPEEPSKLEQILGETHSSLSLECVIQAGAYCCIVTDPAGDKHRVSFYVGILRKENDFYTYEMMNGIVLSAGQDVTLKPNVHGDDLNYLTYQWYQATFEDFDEDDYELSVSSSEMIQGADKSTLTLEKVTKPGDYYCVIDDGWGNQIYVYYHLSLENQFHAGAVNDVTDFKVLYNHSTTLQVTMSCNDPDGITYEWYGATRRDGDTYVARRDLKRISGASEAFFATPAITDMSMFECRVKDKYGNIKRITFNIFVDNQLEFVDTQHKIVGNLNEVVTLSAEVTALNDSGITYEWYEEVLCEDDSGDQWFEHQIIEGANGETLNVKVTEKLRDFYCEARDSFGNLVSKYIRVTFDNGFSAETVEKVVYTELGKGATLTANVTVTNADKLMFSWSYCDESLGEMVTLAEGKDNVYVIPEVMKANWYYCDVDDGYGNVARISFWVDVVEYSDDQFYAAESCVLIAPGEEGMLQVMMDWVHGEKDMQYTWYALVPKAEGGFEQTLIQGETQSSLIISNLSSRTEFLCVVTDLIGGEHPVYFVAGIENDFELDVDEMHYSVLSGERLTLSVTANVDEGDLTYQWYQVFRKYDEQGEEVGEPERQLIAGATKSTYRTGEITERSEYTCVVTDIYGNEVTATFYVAMKNVKSIRPGSDQTYYPLGQQATLKAEVDVIDPSTVTYNWCRYRWRFDDKGEETYEYEDFPENDTDTFVTEPITEFWYYECEIEDNGWYCGTVYFSVGVENHFYVSKMPKDTYYLNADGKVTVDVKARSDKEDQIRYLLFYYGEEGEECLWAGTRPNITLQKTGDYSLAVIDPYGYDSWVSFNVCKDNGFTVEAVNGSEKIVKMGGDVELQVKANTNSEDTITYAWFRDDSEYDESYMMYFHSNEKIDCYESNLVVKNVTRKEKYYCEVSDQSGNSASVEFTIYPEAKRTVTIVSDQGEINDHELWLPAGETTTLQVVAEGYDEPLTYVWKLICDGSEYTIADAKSDKLVINAADRKVTDTYVCYIFDQQGILLDFDYCSIYKKADCNVTFKANGGSGSMAKDVAQKYFSYQLPECKFTAPAGMEFAGWEVKDELYEEGETLISGGDIVVKATWKKQSEIAVIRSIATALDGTIGLQFFVSFSNDTVDDETYAVMTLNGRTVTQKVSRAGTQTVNNYDCYYFTMPVYAKEMFDDVTLKLYDKNGNQIHLESSKGADFTASGCQYSVAKYLQYVQMIPDTVGEKMVNLANNMLEYGIAAKIHLDYNSEGYALSSTTTSIAADAMSHYMATAEGSQPADVKGLAFSLDLKSVTALTMDFTFTSEEAAKNYLFKVDGAPQTPVWNGNTCTLQVYNIGAKDLDEVHSYTITDKTGKELWTVKVSALTYARKAIMNGMSDNNEKLTAIGQGLYLYNQAANEYFMK